MFEAEFSKLEQLIQKLISENQQLTAQVQQLGQKEQQLQQELKKHRPAGNPAVACDGIG